MIRRASIFLSILLSLVGIQADAQQVDVLERTSRDGLFQVVGTDFAGLQTVGAMTDQMERLGLTYFPETRAIPASMRVTLLSDPKFEEPYRINPQPNGNYFVYIAWTGDTRFRDVCQALASVYIRRAAVWRYGQSAGPQAPHWLELAFGQLLESSIRPGYADTQREKALVRPPLGLEELLTVRGPFGLEQEKVALNAVWLFRLLENRISDRTLFRKVLAAFLKNLNPAYIMVKAFPGRFEDREEMEMWWAVGFQSMTRSRETPFFNMEQSRELIRSLAIVTADVGGQDRRMAGLSLWELRDVPTVEVATLQRHREVKLEIQRVNPVYYNAMLSLGLFFETALNAEQQQIVNAQHDRFLSDYRDAQELELEVKRLLRW
ncbi:MAG: hypothetical protein AAFX93_02895 [Verrucomicrobiota bacterium]